MSNKPITCNNITALKAILASSATLDTTTNGVSKYTFKNGTIVNVFDTGTVNFQGKITANCQIKEEVINIINTINKPFCSSGK